MISQWLKWTVVSLAVLMVVLSTAAFFADEPLRRYVERTVNEAVEGYSFKVGTLALHPLALSVDLGDVVVRQEAHPDPPLISIPEVVVDARFAPLLNGKAKGDIRLKNPIISVTQQQINTASAEADQGTEQTVSWQDRIRGMIPFEATLFIKNGEVRYVGQRNAEPIRVTALDIEARNLTNRPQAAQAYPSELVMRSRLFDAGYLEFNGLADLLNKPLPMVDASVKVSGLRIADLMPIVGAYHLVVNRGTFSATGRIMHEKQMVLSLESFVLEGAKIAYVYQEETKSKQRRQLERGAERAAKAHRDPSFVFKVGHGEIFNSEVEFVNRSTDPAYRVFLTDVNADIENFSNRLEEGTGVVKITGKFMGSGPAVVTGTFRPEKPRPDFNLAVKIIKTDVTTLNHVLRAYGDADTHHGKFALFSELTVKNNRIDGYVKPLFRDVDVYDPERDQDKTLSHKIYRAIVDGVMSLLENIPRDEVATKGDVSGPVENPQSSTWQIIAKLVQNAFFNAILPGFEERA
ncbi:MAG TPA: DUF748 domain-containing protein [Nitrospira sp.]|nr:DUF748 domain-containing protein [Nitrospira sp.]